MECIVAYLSRSLIKSAFDIVVGLSSKESRRQLFLYERFKEVSIAYILQQ